MHQGRCTTMTYALEFRTIAEGSSWNEPVLRTQFCCGLSKEQQLELTCRDAAPHILQQSPEVPEPMQPGRVPSPHQEQPIYTMKLQSAKRIYNMDPSSHIVSWHTHRTESTPNPLPFMTLAFEALQQASIFTKLDLHSAYNLVRIREGDDWKTAFITPSGHYEYLIMPFGLMNAPAILQRYINEVLREALEGYTSAYLYDILIYSQTADEHITHVRRVLQLLLENHLFVKLEKSMFHAHTISFLGFVISHNKLCMDPAKVRAVENWPRPTSMRLVQCFLGFTNFYCRFVRKFSAVAAPLIMLTRKVSDQFCWSTKAQQMYEELKSHLIKAPILQHPDAEFVIEMDTSEVDVAEQNYNVGDRKLLAVKLALEEWRHWLEGAKHPFLIWMDHKNLAYVQHAKRLNPRQARRRYTEKSIGQINYTEPLAVWWDLRENGVRIWNFWGSRVYCRIDSLQILHKSFPGFLTGKIGVRTVLLQGCFLSHDITTSSLLHHWLSCFRPPSLNECCIMGLSLREKKQKQKKKKKKQQLS
ncbi:hypothetical protein P4O66_003677 [Electrophorus voltai]|uniref:ribonuclease H n=1 Tax=Electrophorus voltai TaxID=2609070 RepID=A0AAD8ZSW7_9TELE|nr:hypothetical protein P4O66_003677 [Electrophorus voltai]